MTAQAVMTDGIHKTRLVIRAAIDAEPPRVPRSMPLTMISTVQSCEVRQIRPCWSLSSDADLCPSDSNSLEHSRSTLTEAVGPGLPPYA